MNLVIAIVAVVAVVAVAVLLLRKRRAGSASSGDAFYLIPTSAPASSRPAPSPRRTQPLARPLRTGTPRDLGTNAATGGRAGAGMFPFAAATVETPASAAVVPPRASEPSQFPLSNRTAEVSAVIADAKIEAPTVVDIPGAGQRVQGRKVEYFQPTDGTLQFLPGRLEVTDGTEKQHEIRFVRNWGGETEVTFGRNEGAPYRHVQLRSPTVSRMHARMTFENGGWRLRNLSQTNPTIVNGETLTNEDGHRLAEGDEIEMGEVTFRFHEK